MELVSRREDVAFALAKFAKLSERRACELVGVDRSSRRYRARPERQPELRTAVAETAEAHPRYGYRRVTVLLRRAGHNVNHKRVQRLTREMGLQVWRSKRKRLRREVAPVQAVNRPDQEWAMDFVSDAAANGQTIRALTIVDVFTRECLAIEVATSISSRRVARVLEQVFTGGRAPDRIRVDNGPEFISEYLLR
jgi:putative transposase